MYHVSISSENETPSFTGRRLSLDQACDEMDACQLIEGHCQWCWHRYCRVKVMLFLPLRSTFRGGQATSEHEQEPEDAKSSLTT
jgi:hypothetical protein